MTIYDIGTGIAEVTDPAIGLYMAGMADPRQITEGVESSLYARAFIVVDRESGKRVVIVSADIWTCTQVVKTQVINRLKQSNVIKSIQLRLHTRSKKITQKPLCFIQRLFNCFQTMPIFGAIAQTSISREEKLKMLLEIWRKQQEFNRAEHISRCDVGS